MRGLAPPEADEWLDRVELALGPAVEKWRFAAASGDVAEALTAALARTRRKVAVAESCTGGLVAKRITDLPGSSEVFVGGVVAYSDPVKITELGVPPEDLAEHGAVSEPVARRMAIGVAERLGAAAGIGVTGVAGPGGGTAAKPVGTVWVAAVLDGAADVRLLSLVGDRHAIRERAAQDALARLYRLVVRMDSEV